MNFDTAVEHILEFEGGLVDHPKDPGGITKYGISLRAFPDLGADGIRKLTKADAKKIYKEHYWDKVHCDKLPENVRLMVFDCAVNQGVGFATRALQSAASVHIDGIIGPTTLAAVNKRKETLLHKLCMARFGRYKNNPNWEVFGDGWMSRLFEVNILT